MEELYPYFTNDGSVGLFSKEDDDIYHSTYGALSESWQKFIIPAHLEEYIRTHTEIKILDICYGIGYNSKTALNVFIKNALRKKNKNKTFFTKKSSVGSLNYAAIYTNNISTDLKKKKENFFYFLKDFFTQNCTQHIDNIAAIDDNNISSGKLDKNCTNSNFNQECNHILIDAVDLNKLLIELSPFIKFTPQNKVLNDASKNSNLPEKFMQVQKIQNSKSKKIKKELRLKKEVSIVILIKMLENNPEFFSTQNLQAILTDKKYQPFLSRFMMDFSNLYQNQGFKHIKNKNKLAFLHNIYYRHVSRSYKKAKKLLKNNNFELNFHPEDARRFILATNNTYNFIFLDAFTPAKCPSLWTVEFFKELYDKLEDDGMVLTYSNSAAIRNAFLQNGFFVGKIYDADLKKFTGTVATKNNNLIEYNLDKCDLDLINSKAGICFRDEFLNASQETIIENRNKKIEKSDLISSSKVLKGYKNAKSI